MSDHEWCRDVSRDEAVRAAEDAAAVPSIMHRDLPDEVALLRASLADILGRVVRLEGELDAGKDEAEEAATAAGGTKPLEWEVVRHSAAAINLDDHAEAFSELERERPEMDDDGRQWANAALEAGRYAITRLTAERDLAQAVQERLTAERDAARAEVERLRARVAELEAAPAAPPEPESSPGPLAYMMAGAAEKRVFLTREEVYAYGRGLSPIEAASMIFVPLYAAPLRVRRPQRSVNYPHQRDAEWIAAIREAGGEVEE